MCCNTTAAEEAAEQVAPVCCIHTPETHLSSLSSFAPRLTSDTHGGSRGGRLCVRFFFPPSELRFSRIRETDRWRTADSRTRRVRTRSSTTFVSSSDRCLLFGQLCYLFNGRPDLWERTLCSVWWLTSRTPSTSAYIRQDDW